MAARPAARRRSSSTSGPTRPTRWPTSPPRCCSRHPARRRGHVLLGYDERGHCPMLIDGGCSIYEHRPAHLSHLRLPGLPGRRGRRPTTDKVVDRRAGRRWRFSFPPTTIERTHEAVRDAAVYLRTHRDELNPDTVPTNPTHVAVLAVEVHDLFRSRTHHDRRRRTRSTPPSRRGAGEGVSGSSRSGRVCRAWPASSTGIENESSGKPGWAAMILAAKAPRWRSLTSDRLRSRWVARPARWRCSRRRRPRPAHRPRRAGSAGGRCRQNHRSGTRCARPPGSPVVKPSAVVTSL